jgi:hypothetical protein
MYNMQAPRALYHSAACTQWAKHSRQATSRCQMSIQYIIKCMATHRGSQHWLCMGDLELAAIQTMRMHIFCCIASPFHAAVHLFCAITAMYDAAEDYLDRHVLADLYDNPETVHSMLGLASHHLYHHHHETFPDKAARPACTRMPRLASAHFHARACNSFHAHDWAPQLDNECKSMQL